MRTAGVSTARDTSFVPMARGFVPPAGHPGARGSLAALPRGSAGTTFDGSRASWRGPPDVVRDRQLVVSPDRARRCSSAPTESLERWGVAVCCKLGCDFLGRGGGAASVHGPMRNTRPVDHTTLGFGLVFGSGLIVAALVGLALERAAPWSSMSLLVAGALTALTTIFGALLLSSSRTAEAVEGTGEPVRLPGAPVEGVVKQAA